MRFWDASGVVPVLVTEPGSNRMLDVLDEDPEMLVWWGTPVECVSALVRREREGTLSAASLADAVRRLRALGERWQEILPTDTIRSTAQRLLRVHPLRAADALQLAAAVVAAEHDPSSLPLVCLDQRLSEAASREGFSVVS